MTLSQLPYIHSKQQMFHDGLTLLGLKDPGMLQNPDIHDIASSVQLLCWFFQNIHDSVFNNEVERRGVDDMVKLAFCRVASIHKMQ
jgi:hypothetical protein